MTGLPQLMSTADAAEYLHLKVATVVTKCRLGELPAVKVGRHWFVHVARLAEQLDQTTSAPRPSAPRSSDNDAGVDPGGRRGRRELHGSRPPGNLRGKSGHGALREAATGVDVPNETAGLPATEVVA